MQQLGRQGKVRVAAAVGGDAAQGLRIHLFRIRRHAGGEDRHFQPTGHLLHSLFPFRVMRIETWLDCREDERKANVNGMVHSALGRAERKTRE